MLSGNYRASSGKWNKVKCRVCLSEVLLQNYRVHLQHHHPAEKTNDLRPACQSSIVSLFKQVEDQVGRKRARNDDETIESSCTDDLNFDLVDPHSDVAALALERVASEVSEEQKSHVWKLTFSAKPRRLTPGQPLTSCHKSRKNWIICRLNLMRCVIKPIFHKVIAGKKMPHLMTLFCQIIFWWTTADLYMTSNANSTNSATTKGRKQSCAQYVYQLLKVCPNWQLIKPIWQYSNMMTL